MFPARHGRSSGSRHAFRRAAVRSLGRRPRLMATAAVACAGLAVAFWLPTRNDSASAMENGRRGTHSQQRDGWGAGARQNADWGRDSGHRPQFPAPTGAPTTAPSSEPPTSEPPTGEPPTDAPTTAPPTTTPPATTTPPTTAPPTSTPPTTAPAARKWAPFTDYHVGDLITFDGITYKVKADHTSLPGWEPPAVPALFALVG
jgi:hypothetical protein